MKNYRMQSLVLVLIAFALGFSEFIIVGVLPDIAKTFHEPVTIFFSHGVFDQLDFFQFWHCVRIGNGQSVG